MILVAPTSFKGSHSAWAVAQAMTRAAATFGFEVVTRPVSDGGPGLIDALALGNASNIHSVCVTGPLGYEVTARILVHGTHAIVESADACGLDLVPPEQRNPLHATTFGVGQLLLAARHYSSEIIVGLGGSATIDCGFGMARALGFHFLDAHGNELSGSDALLKLTRINGESALAAKVTALADVRSALYGAGGAVRVFGPQKGATPEQVEMLDGAFERAADVMQRDLSVNVRELRGAGAAGGLGAGLHAFAGASVVSGSDWLLREIDADTLIARAALLITGEGAYDAQSSLGKITGELIARAGRAHVPVLLVAGAVDGSLPSHVRAVRSTGHLELADIQRLTREALPSALAAR